MADKTKTRFQSSRGVWGDPKKSRYGLDFSPISVKNYLYQQSHQANLRGKPATSDGLFRLAAADFYRALARLLHN